MRVKGLAWMAATGAIALAGCADEPILVDCGPNLKLEDFAHAVRPTPASRGPELSAMFEQNIARAQADPARTGRAPPTFVLLSGGGEWGAYGAGFLEGWSASTDPAVARPDKPDAVTGISTGSLQATLVFLGKHEDDSLIRFYSITDQNQLVHDRGKYFVVGHGSEGDQRPLVDYLYARISPRVDEVAKEWVYEGPQTPGQPARGHAARQLWVGIADGAKSELEAIDLVQLAATTFPTRDDRDHCYVSALIASSAIPVLLTQVRETHPGGDPSVYLDGGALQSVFTPPLLRAWATASSHRRAGGARAFVLFNTGTKAAPFKQGDLDATVLGAANLTYRAFLQQVEVQSAYDVGLELRDFKIYYTTADNSGCSENPKFRFFDPAFMRCLIACGRSRWRAAGDGRAVGWLDADTVGDATGQPTCTAPAASSGSRP